jgi:peptidoglycan/xylan/chitin deacetylase (PgdA/CDA1 family)
MADTALPVLMYHGLHVGPRSRGVFDAVYSVDPLDFARQLDWLAQHGYRTVRLRDLPRLEAGARCVVITFDDGDVSNHEIALPLLLARGMVAEFFVTAAFVGQPGRLSSADVRALADAGMGVQSHGLTHALLADLSADDLDYELRESKRRLEAIVQEPVQALALPGGRGATRERIAALRLGYSAVLNSVPGRNRGYAPGRYLQRIAVTRGMHIEAFAQLVQWRGMLPRVRALRYHALAWMKHALGNQHYEVLRKRVLER